MDWAGRCVVDWAGRCTKKQKRQKKAGVVLWVPQPTSKHEAALIRPTSAAKRERAQKPKETLALTFGFCQKLAGYSRCDFGLAAEYARGFWERP